ncbi:hypothetical protein HY493_04415 [Candidatus Woesearchaeota archaeon]|nr:hypothetical protein [Candidatus Woesearchaeota archaeon]
MLKRLIIGIVLAFSLGWLASLAVGTPSVPVPVETAQAVFGPNDVPGPITSLLASQVHVFNDRVEIDMGDMIPAVFTDTDSMGHTLDQGTIALEQTITDPRQVQVGDIVSYKTPLAPDAIIIHRVIEIGNDEEGVFYIFQGDGLSEPDPAKVRFSQLQREVIGLLYTNEG